MLDIIITHYKEDWPVCRKLFAMMYLQRCVDWNQITVTVIKDGGHRLPEDRLAELSFPVRQIDIPHGGISAARNAGIRNAVNPWIMFCDCDDSFANLYSLHDVLQVLGPKREEKYDLLWCDCIEEYFTDGQRLLFVLQKIKTFVFVHGKIYRRKFLLDENIRFDESLDFNEDSLFNAVILARTSRFCKIQTPAPVYVWIRRDGSVTAS